MKIADRIVDTPVSDELEDSYLSYALSVILSRAIPDVRDGLKPVQRRLLYSLYRQRILASGPYKKSARVVGDTMGRYHPHGDAALYETLVRMVQPFTLRLPVVDGHGNFGSLDDGPAAARYTEVRLDAAGEALLADLDEDTVDFRPNYDNTETEPEVLPAAFPNLLVNGATGIAVGMSTSIPPHNLTETVAAAKALLADPNLGLAELLDLLPGPDFPVGGEIVDLADVHDAYRTGKGSFRLRARLRIVDVSPRRKGIEVTELPYMVGPEQVIAKIRTLIGSKRLEGIADVRDLSDRTSGLRLLIEIKAGYQADRVLAALLKLTPLETTVPVSLVVLDGGRPVTVSLDVLVARFLEHRRNVVRRRSQFRLAKAADRAHLVDALLDALDQIDQVVDTIRRSRSTDTARRKLRNLLKIDETQAAYLLEMPLRRLTGMETAKLRAERKELTATISKLNTLLKSPKRLDETVAAELDAVAARFGTPRRTALAPSRDIEAAAVDDLQLPDVECRVGLVGENIMAFPTQLPKSRRKPVLFDSLAVTSTRGEVWMVTSAGRLCRLPMLEVPFADRPTSGIPVTAIVELDASETAVALLSPGDLPLALATSSGKVKRVVPTDLTSAATQQIITVADGDKVVGAGFAGDDAELLFVTSDGKALRTAAANVRPQRRAGSGMRGVRLGDDAEVVAFAVPAADDELWLLTDTGGVKHTPVDAFPTKGRGTAGVRAVRFRADERRVVAARAAGQVVATTRKGRIADPPPTAKRDGTATRTDHVPVALQLTV